MHGIRVNEVDTLLNRWQQYRILALQWKGAGGEVRWVEKAGVGKGCY